MEDAGKAYISAFSSVIHIKIAVVVIHRQTKKKSQSIFIPTGQLFITQKAFCRIGSLFDQKSAIFLNGVNGQLPVAGADKMRRVLVKRPGLFFDFSDKKFIIRMVDGSFV